MAFMMGSTMAVIILLFMLGMYENEVVNAAILGTSVLELADEIISAQRREIDEMAWLIADIAENGEVTTEAELKTRLVADFTATNGRDELTADGG